MKSSFASKIIFLASLIGASFGAQSSTQTGIQVVIFDWAGTTVDHGSLAPISAFKKVFAEEGVQITNQEARAPMGVHKRTHIEKITQLPALAPNTQSVSKRWQKAHQGRSPSSSDIDRMFTRFVPLQLEAIKDHSKLINGTLDTFNYVKSKNWKVGTTTGYTSEMLALVRESAAKQGYKPDYNVASDMVKTSRPSANMVFMNCAHFNISPNFAVKIDDTLPGIEEGLNAGAWTIMVLETGNALGLSENELSTLSQKEKSKRLAIAKREAEKKAHYTINSIAEAPKVLEEIDKLIKQGALAFNHSAPGARV